MVVLLRARYLALHGNQVDRRATCLNLKFQISIRWLSTRPMILVPRFTFTERPFTGEYSRKFRRFVWAAKK